MSVVLDPSSVVGARRAGDVGDDRIFLEHDLEEGAPLGEVGWMEGEGDRNVLVDVDAGKGGEVAGRR